MGAKKKKPYRITTLGARAPETWRYPVTITNTTARKAYMSPGHLRVSPLCWLHAAQVPRETKSWNTPVATATTDLIMLTCIDVQIKPLTWVVPKNALRENNFADAARLLSKGLNDDVLSRWVTSSWFLRTPEDWPDPMREVFKRAGLEELQPWEVVLASLFPTKAKTAFQTQFLSCVLLGMGVPPQMILDAMNIFKHDEKAYFQDCAKSLAASLWFQLWFHAPSPEAFVTAIGATKSTRAEFLIEKITEPWRYSTTTLVNTLKIRPERVRQLAFGFRNPSCRAIPPVYILR